MASSSLSSRPEEAGGTAVDDASRATRLRCVTRARAKVAAFSRTRGAKGMLADVQVVPIAKNRKQSSHRATLSNLVLCGPRKGASSFPFRLPFLR